MESSSPVRDFVESMFAAIDRGDWAALPQYFTDDVTYERPGYPPLVGIEALLNFYREVRIIKTGAHDVWRIVGSNDSAACWGKFTGTARDGRPLEARFADVYDLRDGRIRHRTTHFFQPAI